MPNYITMHAPRSSSHSMTVAKTYASSQTFDFEAWAEDWVLTLAAAQGLHVSSNFTRAA